MKDVKSLIAKQYTDFIYPEPISDLEAYHNAGGRYLVDPSLCPGFLWPEGHDVRSLNILVAGCGTNQAALFAYENPSAHVIGVDLSLNSLAHEKFLQQKHDIRNLELVHGDLLDVAELETEFDLIICTGVLHHMQDPLAGLRALSKVMHHDGVLHGMLYAKAARVGVYWLQEFYKLLGLTQTEQSIALVKESLKKITRDHPAWFFINHLTDVKYDSGLVDLFLNASDVAFSVSDVLDLVRQADLAFQGWTDNSRYYPESLFGPGPISEQIRGLSIEKQWEAVEKVRVSYSLHDFLLCHPSKLNDRRPIFEGETWEDEVPTRTVALKIVRRPSSEDATWGLSRAEIVFSLPEAAFQVVKLCDGSLSVREIIQMFRLKYGSSDAYPAFIKDVCRSMYERGHLYISKAKYQVEKQSAWVD